MQPTIEYIRTSLSGTYQKEEIESFILMIFNHLCNYSRADIIINKNIKLSDLTVRKTEDIVTRLLRHEPIQYILGHAWFLDFSFNVRPGVLIPRPETEELVELIASDLNGRHGEILDIGTGSGCIAISLSKILPLMKVSAWDVSPQALEIARENNAANNATVEFSLIDVLKCSGEGLSGHFDAIVSNPPYVCESEKSEMLPNVLDHEPHLALFVSDSDPLLFYRTIAQLGMKILKPGGTLYFEINAMFGQETAHMLGDTGYTCIEILTDIHGKQRMTRSVKPA